MLSKLLGGIGGYVIVGLVAALVSAFGSFNAGVTHGYGKAMRGVADTNSMCITREIALWHEKGACHVSQIELATQIETALQVTGNARARMAREMENLRTRNLNAAALADAAIGRLKNVESVWDWASQPLPDDLLKPFCLRDGQTGCDPCSPTADGNDDLDVCLAATGDGNGD